MTVQPWLILERTWTITKNERGITMKRLVCVLLILCLLPVIVFAEVDLSSMSFDELKSLQQKINEEIHSRPEWKSVEVPSGYYTVGKDIPSGDYSISGDGCYIGVYRNDRLYLNQGISCEDDFINRIDLIDGDTVKIMYGIAIFAPPVSLGF